MKNLTICFLCQDINFASLICATDEMGHAVSVRTHNTSMAEICQTEHIPLWNALKNTEPDITVILDDTKEIPSSQYVIRLCSSEQSISTEDEYLKRGNFFHWLVFDENRMFQTFGEVFISDDSTSKNIVLDDLKETLADIIVSISREEPLKNSVKNKHALTQIETLPYTQKIEQTLYDALIVLLQRYFTENCRVVKSDQYLLSGRLDGIYRINDLTQHTFSFLSEPILLLISTEPFSGNTLVNPDALIMIRKHQNNVELVLYFSHYRYTHFLKHLLFLHQELLNSRSIQTIEFLTNEERKHILSRFNQPTFDHQQQSIIDMFDEMVNHNPHQIAIIFEEESWTYQHISDMSHTIAQRVTEYSLPLETPILVALERSPVAIAALFGILRSGCCYVPLDPSYPHERLTAMMSDTKAPLCLSQVKDSQLFDIDFENINTLYIDQLNHAALKTDFSYPKISPDSLAYIIYTSGSTGVPKGVMIEHRNVVNLAKAEAKICDLTSSSRVLNVASLGFDAAGWDIYGALLNGGTLVIAPTTIHKLPDELHAFIHHNQITFATLTPAVLTLMPQNPIPSLQTLVVMGDVCSVEIMDLWAKNCRLFNGYGPTEATIGALMSEYIPGKEHDCIGKPLQNYQVYILDEHLNSQPIGIIGEICIAGAGVARGYYNHPTATNERFLSHFFSKENIPIRLYRTGDLGYWNQHGEIIFVGRIDHQVKIHGVRIELREIELIIEKYNGIDQAVVMATGSESNKKLVAWVTLKQNAITPALVKHTLQSHLKKFLHPAVVPQNIIVLEQFPLNTNGKIDRKKLSDTTDIAEEQHVAVSDENMSEKEKIIQAIVQDLLHISHISAQQNIFDLGIHSLTAAQIIARINNAFELNLSSRHVFEKPTIATLATLVQQHIENHPIYEKIVPLAQRQGPLTPSQQQLWFLHQLTPNNTSYNLPLALELKGKMDIEVLQKALDMIIERHESFRIIFGHVKGIPFQRVLDSNPIQLIPIQIKEENLADELTQRCQRSFDLVHTPPVSISFFKISTEHHVLYFVKHNLITDAWSEGLIIKELATCYNHLLAGDNIVFTPLPVQMIDVANFMKNPKNQQSLPDDLSYWRKKMSHYEPFELPHDFHRPMSMEGTGYRYRHDFKTICWSEIQSLARQHHCTAFMLLVAALNVLVYKYTRKTDIVLGTALAGRTTSEIENISGFFVNTLPIRVDFNSKDCFIDILAKTRETCLEAYHHQSASFDSIVETTKAERFLNKNPLFQIMIILNNADEWRFPKFGSANTNHLLVQTFTSMFDMTWNFFETKDTLFLDIDYSTELFEHQTIERLIQNFETLLGSLITHFQHPIDQLPMLSDQQITWLNQIAQGPSIDLEHTSIIPALEQTVKKYGHYPALRDHAGVLTYHELWDDTNRIALGILSFFAQTKVKSTPHVAIVMNRDANMIKAILAVLKAGKSYIPIDPSYPNDRIQAMIVDSEVALIISDTHHDYNQAKIITVNELLTLGEHYPNKALPTIGENETAYILYTSGSTGHPKGVMVSHGNLINFCQDFVSRLDLNTEDKFLSITTISFDIFGLELFCTLLAGAELILAHQDIARNPVHLVNFIIDIKPTIMQATPTMWSMIIDHIPVSDQLTILCGGEALPSNLLPLLQAHCKKLFNLYGPTETTIWSTAADLTTQKSVHIGKPISNTQCHILDEEMMPTPIGAWGDLYISGKGVTKGYWNKPEITQNVFIKKENTILYKTGDRAKWDLNGHLIYGGRSDFQVKLRGHRIELGEIESCLVTHPDISEAVVHLADYNHDKILVGYFIPKENTSPPPKENIRAFLEEKLPAYMIPSTFMALDTWPLTPNHKIDRRKLPSPEEQGISAYGQYIPPANELEQTLQSIWQSVLQMENISVLENFFSLGGHSLHIPQIVASINDKQGMRLTIREFILNSTIRELGVFLTKNRLEHAPA